MESIRDLIQRTAPPGVQIPALSPEEYERQRKTWYNTTAGNLDKEDGINCDRCRNRGFIENESGELAECSCMKQRRAVKAMRSSGLGGLIDKTFEGYDISTPWRECARNMAQTYANKTDDSWLYFGGQHGCVDADTEFFDGSKWTRIADYNGGKVLQYDPSTKKASLVLPTRFIKKKAQELYHLCSATGSVNQVLSSDHNFAYVTSKGHMQKKPFSDVMAMHYSTVQGFYGRIETAFHYSGKGIDLSDNDIRLMCAVIADGSFHKKLTLCTVNVKKERKKERMRELLASQPYKEYKKSDGYSMFRFYSPRREKIFTDYWYDCTERQLEIICDEVFRWDGNVDHEGRRTFFTTQNQSADFVQFALSATGKRSTITIDERKDKKKCYVVHAIKGGSLVRISSSGGTTKAKITEYKPIDGKQYCFAVDSGYLVLRRNNRIFITGNCGKTHLCTAVCKALIDQGRSVKYMLWGDISQHLDALKFKADEYERFLGEIKSVDVLYIDDFLKTATDANNEPAKPGTAELHNAYTVINARYFADKKTIISSEHFLTEYECYDGAAAGRIREKVSTQILIKREPGRNYRKNGGMIV